MTRAIPGPRSAVAGPILLLVSIGLAACTTFGTACSAVGYSSVAQITLANPREGLHLQLCDGENCEPGPPSSHDGIEPAPTSEMPGTQDDGTIGLAGNSLTGWSADFIGGQPEIGYRLSTADGEIVAEGDADVEWVRVGGTADCGGPRQASIELPG